MLLAMFTYPIWVQPEKILFPYSLAETDIWLHRLNGFDSSSILLNEECEHDSDCLFIFKGRKKKTPAC